MELSPACYEVEILCKVQAVHLREQQLNSDEDWRGNITFDDGHFDPIKVTSKEL